MEVSAVSRWGGEPAIEREYGVKSLEHRTYRLDGQVVEAIVEHAPDASSAYGLLTFYQTEAMAPAKDVQLTMVGPQGALMARGRFFIRVPRPAAPSFQVSDHDFRALLILMGGTRPSGQEKAKLPAALPTKGMLPGSEKYLLGVEASRRVLPSFRSDLIGFAQGAEVHLAAYLRGEARVTLMVITYPTPQIARVRFGAMEKFLPVNQDHGPGSLYGRRTGSFVLLVLDSNSPATAARLMEQFQVSGHISWDERYPGDKPVSLQLVELVLANFLLILILVGFAFMGGILVFLSMRFFRRWFPQSPWVNPEEGSIIRLNLS